MGDAKTEIGQLAELQQTLYSSRNPTRRWLHRSRLERVSGAVRESARQQPSARALEIGPGAGPYLNLLCDLYTEVVATDIEPQHLEHLRAEMAGLENLSLVEDDIADSTLEPESFDLVLCTEVIEHIPDPAAAVRGLARLLKPGGRLVLSTPQKWSPVEILGRIAFRPGVIRVVRAIYREPILPTGHISLRTRRQVREMIAAAGLLARDPELGGVYVPILAEVGGERALRLEQLTEEPLRRSLFRGMLWTQYWIAERPA